MKVENIFLDLVNGMTDEKLDKLPAPDEAVEAKDDDAKPVEQKKDAPATEIPPILPGESGDDYINRLKNEARKQGKSNSMTTIPFNKYSGRDFNEMIRHEIGRVVDGDIDRVAIALQDATTMLEPEEYAKRFERSRSYIRTIMDKSPKVASVGKIKMKVVYDADNMPVWVFTIDKNPTVAKKRSGKEIKKEAAKMAKRVLELMLIPANDLRDDELIIFNRMLKKSKDAAWGLFMNELSLKLDEDLNSTNC